MSLERKGETQLWRASEESGLVAAMGAAFVGIAKVDDAARDSKATHGVVTLAMMTC